MDIRIFSALSKLFSTKAGIVVTGVALVGASSAVVISNRRARQEEIVHAEERSIVDNPIDLGQRTEQTFKVVFPYQEPESNDEKIAEETLSPVVYMNYLRTKHNVKLMKAMNDAFNLSSISPLKGFIQELETNSSLAPYIPLEDISLYQQSRPNYQGTHVPAKGVLYQAVHGRLIPITTTSPGQRVEPEPEWFSRVKEALQLRDNKIYPDYRGIVKGYFKYKYHTSNAGVIEKTQSGNHYVMALNKGVPEAKIILRKEEGRVDAYVILDNNWRNLRSVNIFHCRDFKDPSTWKAASFDFGYSVGGLVYVNRMQGVDWFESRTNSGGIMVGNLDAPTLKKIINREEVNATYVMIR
ncbi:hypothetical protein ACFLZ6_01270 [Nanoarchaeota archaeon]